MNKNLKKTSEKKTLRKVKKNWVVMAVATFALIGGASVVSAQSKTAYATETTQQSAGSTTDTKSADAQQSVAQANTDSTKVGQSQSAQPASTATTTTTTSTVQSSDVKATGKWGDVDFTFSNEGVLTLTGTGTLSKDFPGNISKSDVTKVVITNTVKLPSDSTELFANFVNATEFDGLDKVDANDLENADALFSQDHNVQSLDVSAWKTPKLNFTRRMFSGLHNVKTINVTGLDTSNVTNMEEMFGHDYHLTDIVGINTLSADKVTAFTYFVAWDVSLTTLDLSGFNTISNADLTYMFYTTPSLQTINLAGFNNSQAGSVNAFDLDTYFQDGNDVPTNVDLTKRQIASIITGPNFDLSKVSFPGTPSGINYYNLVGDKAELNDSTKPASTDWVAAVIKVVDRDNPNQVMATLLFQGKPGSKLNIGIPSGYNRVDDSTKTITLGNTPIQNVDVLVYKEGTTTSSSSSASSSSQSSAASNSSSSSNASSSTIDSSASSNGIIDEHKNNTGKSHKDTDKQQSKGHVNNANKHTQSRTDVNNNHEALLPQTGQRSTKAAEIFGLVLIVLSLGLVAFHRHDHHKR